MMTKQEATDLEMAIKADAVGGRLIDTHVVNDIGPSGRVESYSITAKDPFTRVPYRLFSFEEWDALRKALARAFEEEDQRRK